MARRMLPPRHDRLAPARPNGRRLLVQQIPSPTMFAESLIARAVALIAIPILLIAGPTLGSLVAGTQETLSLVLGILIATTTAVLLFIVTSTRRSSVVSDQRLDVGTGGQTRTALKALPDDILSALASTEYSTKLAALYELEILAQSSRLGARLAIPAIEDMIRSAVPEASSLDSMVERRTSADAKPEVQIGLIILGTIPREVRGSVRYRLNRLDLRGYSFEGLDMAAASFEYSILDRCVMVDGVFDGADFRDASLTEVVGGSASFRRALLERVSFREAILSAADFDGSLILATDFNNAILVGANFDAAVVVDSHFKGTDREDSTPPDALMDAELVDPRAS